jgi:hypothetical protein
MKRRLETLSAHEKAHGATAPSITVRELPEESSKM